MQARSPSNGGTAGLSFTVRLDLPMASAETFVLVALTASAVALSANVLLWVPIVGKVFYLVGKILRVVGFIIGLVDIWAILAWYGLAPVPF